MSDSPISLVPAEGWHVMHLFYHVDHGQWQLLSDGERREAKTSFTELVQEIRTETDTQLLTFAIATPKADLGFMLLTPDLQIATAFENSISDTDSRDCSRASTQTRTLIPTHDPRIRRPVRRQSRIPLRPAMSRLR